MTYKVPWSHTNAAERTAPPVAQPPPEAAAPATATPPEEQRGAFYSLSIELTGFDEVELLGTGAGDAYLAWLLRAFADVMPELLDAWRAVEAGYPPGEREAGIRQEILADPKLGPFAQGVNTLWYTATWHQLDPKWSKAYGQHPEDVNRAFGTAYPEGLVWKAAAGPHPGGAKPTGFGTWAFRPEEA